MKKLISIPVIALALCLLMSSCNTGSDPADTTNTNTTAPETTAAAETEAETTDYFEANRIELVTPDTSRVLDMSIGGDGYDIYCVPDNGNGGHHYGASYLYHEDGSVDVYMACGGIPGEWDWITYRHSDDNGQTWGPEKVVVAPTPGSLDHFSCCDPDVVFSLTAAPPCRAT